MQKLTRSEEAGEQVAISIDTDRGFVRKVLTQAGGLGLGTETGGLDQTHLITAGGELATLITLHHHPATGFDPDHPGPHPAKGGGFQHLHDVTGL